MSQPSGSQIRTSRLDIKKIYEEEEDDNIVFSIREEIIDNTLNKIDKLTQEVDLLKFVSDCAVDALKKVVSLYFYYHAETVNLKNPAWSPDEPISPSPPDTWSTKMVPVKPKPVVIQVSRTVEELDQDDQEPKSCECDLGVICLCTKSKEERIEEALQELLIEKPKKKGQSVLSSSVASSRKSSLERSTVVSYHESYEDESSMNDSTIKKVTTQVPFDDKPKDKFVKLPKICTPSSVESKQVESKIVELELPPIRIDATFQCLPVENLVQRKSQKKKKKKDKRF